jgi:electron transport complex protein RnfG
MRSVARLIVALSITCLGSALALAVIHGLTEEPIEEQKRLAIMRAIQEVLPPFDNDPVENTRQIVLEDDEVGAEKQLMVYLGLRENEITGVAFAVYGEGYGGLIHVMVGIDLQEEISGVKILEHLETPGLGAKIEESSFTDQFKGKSLENSVLVNGNLAVKKDGGDMDALTGATISPRGIAMAASAGLKIFKRHRHELLGFSQDGDTTEAVPPQAEKSEVEFEESEDEEEADTP